MYKSCQLVFLFLFLLSVTVINAQDKVEFSVLSESESTFTSYEKDSAATAVYLYEYGNNYFEIRDNYIWLITKYHAKIKILEKEGFDYSNIEIPLYRSKDRKEKIVKIKGLTHNGEVKTYVKKPEFFEEEVSEKWSQIKFTFPNEAEIVKGCFKFPGTKDDSDCEALKYVMKDIPAFEDSEEYMLSSNNYRSKLEFELSEYKTTRSIDPAVS